MCTYNYNIYNILHKLFWLYIRYNSNLPVSRFKESKVVYTSAKLSKDVRKLAWFVVVGIELYYCSYIRNIDK